MSSLGKRVGRVNQGREKHVFNALLLAASRWLSFPGAWWERSNWKRKI